MKKHILFTLSIIALLSTQCSSNKNSHQADESTVSDKIVTQILHFPESGDGYLRASYFADTLIYIPLETTEESLLDYALRQVWIDSSFILVNSRKSGLFLFQKDGKFLKQIGKKGRGPGEYGNIFHFEVILDTIYVSSTGRRGFLRYTFDGTFCDEIKLNYQPVYFSTTPDQKLACYNIDEGKIFLYNSVYTAPDTIVVEYGVTKGRYMWTYSDLDFTYLQKYSDGLLFYDYRSDTVWNITNNRKEPVFIINMKNKLPFDKQIEFCNGNLQEWKLMVESYQLVHIRPLSSCILVFQKHWYKGWYDAIYVDNTKTGETKRFNKNFIWDDIVSQEAINVTNYLYSPDFLVARFYPPVKDLKQDKDNNKGVPSQKWLDQMKTVKEDDNPILVLIKIKKNL
jgi:hypothetical protein